MMTCNLCGGLLALLGQLGRLRWFRCIDCGADCSQSVHMRRKGKAKRR